MTSTRYGRKSYEPEVRKLNFLNLIILIKSLKGVEFTFISCTN